MHLHDSYLLHRRDYRNSSLLLELFTRDQGRLPAIAKGVKSARSKKQGELQSFQPLQLALSGRGEIRNITTVDATEPPIHLVGKALYCGLYLNELLMRMTARGDPHPELYHDYQLTLRTLADGGAIDHQLRQFEIAMLQALGYGLVLDCEVESGEALQPEQSYRYQIEHGPVRVTSARQDGYTVPGHVLLAMGSGEVMPAACARQAKQLMRLILAHYLGAKPLKSRELFQSIAK